MTSSPAIEIPAIEEFALDTTDLRPYTRLDQVDRNHAKSLVNSCRVSPAAVKTSRILATHSLIQVVVTSIPLILADFFTIWFLLFGTTAFVERAFGLPNGFVTRESALLVSVLLVPIAHLAGLYPAMGTTAAVEFRQLVRAGATALCIFAGIGMLQDFGNWPYYVGSTLLTMLLAVPILPASRFMARAVGRRCNWWGAPILIYADNAATGREIFNRLESAQERGLRPVAVLLDAKEYWKSEAELEGIPSSSVQNVLNVAATTKATWLLVAKPKVVTADQSWNQDNEIDAFLHAIPNRVLLPSLDGIDCGMWDRTHTIGASCGLLLANSRHCDWTLSVKRVLDVVLSGMICLMISPILLAIIIAIRLSSPGPIFYSQTRVGRGGRNFKAWKFRSMVPNADKVLHQYLKSNPDFEREWNETHKLKNDPRITWIGKILRTTSLDELPQLWNILRGDMSLVGPRPIVNSPTYDATYIRDYPREYAVYTSVRPGLTGMWQVTCRNSGVYEMRIYWDMYYIRNWTLWLDLYILLRTIRTVVMREGSA